MNLKSEVITYRSTTGVCKSLLDIIIHKKNWENWTCTVLKLLMQLLLKNDRVFNFFKDLPPVDNVTANWYGFLEEFYEDTE
jgi:hypothetical protein